MAGRSRRTPSTVLAELALAARVLGGAAPPVDTVFFGGGTPTLLDADDLGRMLDGIDKAFGLAARRRDHHRGQPGVGDRRRRCARCAQAGFTRISLGMQSVAPHVLALLDRQHTPGRAVAAAGRRGRPDSRTSTSI